MEPRHQAILQLVLECLLLPFKVLWYWLLSTLLFLVPTRFVAKDVSGQTVLITGAGGGLGRLMAKRFASLGCRLVLWDIDQTLNERAAAQVREYGFGVSTYTVDLSNRQQIVDIAEKVKEEVGRIDILVNNAGVVFGNSILNSQPVQIVKTMEVNCLAHFWTIQAFMPAMVERNSGHIVSIASSAGMIGLPNMADYSSSKFAAVGLDEALRLELLVMNKTGVKTTAVCPFIINTGMFDGCSLRFPLIMDILTPEYVADRVIDAVLREDELIVVPRLLYVFVLLKLLMPVKCQNILNDFFGGTQLMANFSGRHTKIK